MPRTVNTAAAEAQRPTRDALAQFMTPPVLVRESSRDFVRSLLSSFASWGSWTDRQFAAAQRVVREVNDEAQRAVMGAVAEVAADAAALPAAVAAPAGLDRIHALFATARANGLRSPRLTIANGVQLTAQRADADAINVREGGFYRGTIRGGIFRPAHGSTASLTETLARLAANPTAELTAYGRATGRCSCCSRPLTDPVSVAMSIGPICAARFGISRAGVTPAAAGSVTLAEGTPTPAIAPTRRPAPSTNPFTRAIRARAAAATIHPASPFTREYDDDEILR
jgi:hypothetical protein